MQWMDGASFFKLRRRTQTLHIRISDDVDYLGVVLSYRNFELATAKHRIKKAGITYKPLQKVLRVKGPLGMRYKLRIHRACALACLLYGLIGVGLTQASFKLVSSCVCKHIRKILCVREEGVSNLAVLERASIDLHADLVGRSRALIASIAGDTGRTDTLKRTELDRAKVLGRNLEILGDREDLSKLVRVPEGESGVVDCPCCGLYFASRQSLNMHFNSRHPEIQLSKQKFDRARHSLFGLPVCRFCRERQFSWQVLSQHISCGMCPVVKDGVGRGLTFMPLTVRCSVSAVLLQYLQLGPLRYSALLLWKMQPT